MSAAPTWVTKGPGGNVTGVATAYDSPGAGWERWTGQGVPVVGAAPGAIVFKADVWRRCTEAEAATLDAALEQAPVQMRRLWDDSQQLHRDAPEFALLQAQMEATFGVARTAELLAPSA